MALTFTSLGAYEASWLCTQVFTNGGTAMWSSSGECDVQTSNITAISVMAPAAKGETILLAVVYPNGNFGVFGDGSRVQDDRGHTWEADAFHSPNTNFGLFTGASGNAWTKIYRCNVATPLQIGDQIRVKGAVVMRAWKVNARLQPYSATYTAPGYGNAAALPYIDDYNSQFLVAQGKVLEFGAVSHRRGRDSQGATTAGFYENYPVETLSMLGTIAMLDFSQGQWGYHEQIYSGSTPASSLIHDHLYTQWWTLWPGYREVTAADVPAYYRFGSRVNYAGISAITEAPGAIPFYPSSRAVAYYRIGSLGYGGPSSVFSQHGRYAVATEQESRLRIRSAPGAFTGFDYDTRIGPPGAMEPRLAWNPAGDALQLLYLAPSGYTELITSNDSGKSWSNPVTVFTGSGTFRQQVIDQHGYTVYGIFTELNPSSGVGMIQVARQGIGDAAPSLPEVITREGGAPLFWEPVGWTLAASNDAQNAWRLTATLEGEGADSQWISTDRCRTFRRLP